MFVEVLKKGTKMIDEEKSYNFKGKLLYINYSKGIDFDMSVESKGVINKGA